MPYKDSEKRKECARQTYHRNKEKNREKRNERNRKHYQDNIEKERERIRNNKIKRKENNPEKYRKVYSKWDTEKRKNDPLYKFKKNFSNKLRKSLKNYGFKKTGKTITILGISYKDFREHLESQFEPWMTWDNYGLYNGDFNYGWDIDHIIPTSSAHTEEELYRLNHYTNLRPLCSKVNRDIKKDIISPNTFYDKVYCNIPHMDYR